MNHTVPKRAEISAVSIHKVFYHYAYRRVGVFYTLFVGYNRANVQLMNTQHANWDEHKKAHQHHYAQY